MVRRTSKKGNLRILLSKFRMPNTLSDSHESGNKKDRKKAQKSELIPRNLNRSERDWCWNSGYIRTDHLEKLKKATGGGARFFVLAMLGFLGFIFLIFFLNQNKIM